MACESSFTEVLLRDDLAAGVRVLGPSQQRPEVPLVQSASFTNAEGVTDALSDRTSKPSFAVVAQELVAWCRIRAESSRQNFVSHLSHLSHCFHVRGA